MRIVVIGAGAIGGWLAFRLADAGHDVGVLARGETLAAIRRDGLTLTENGSTRSLEMFATDAPEELTGRDLVIVAVKGQAVPGLAPTLAALLGPRTTVLPAINGVPWWFTQDVAGPLAGVTLETVDPGGRIAAAVPVERVVGCVVHVASATKSPGHVVHALNENLIIGEPDGSASSRVAGIRQALESARVEVAVSGNIRRDAWYKLWGNMTMNPITTLTGARLDEATSDPLVRGFAVSVMREAAEIGSRIGCPIAESGEERLKLAQRLRGVKTSMLQDREAGRTLEIDGLLAAPREIAARLGVATPNLDALYGLIRLFDAVRTQGTAASGAR